MVVTAGAGGSSLPSAAQVPDDGDGLFTVSAAALQSAQPPTSGSSSGGAGVTVVPAALVSDAAAQVAALNAAAASGGGATPGEVLAHYSPAGFMMAAPAPLVLCFYQDTTKPASRAGPTSRHLSQQLEGAAWLRAA